MYTNVFPWHQPILLQSYECIGTSPQIWSWQNIHAHAWCDSCRICEVWSSFWDKDLIACLFLICRFSVSRCIGTQEVLYTQTFQTHLRNLTFIMYIAEQPQRLCRENIQAAVELFYLESQTRSVSFTIYYECSGACRRYTSVSHHPRNKQHSMTKKKSGNCSQVRRQRYIIYSTWPAQSPQRHHKRRRRFCRQPEHANSCQHHDDSQNHFYDASCLILACWPVGSCPVPT